MEPAGDGGTTGVTHSAQFAPAVPQWSPSVTAGRPGQPQWSPPAAGRPLGRGSWPRARSLGVTPPQWSPPTSDGTTSRPRRHGPRREHTVMDPAEQRRDDAFELLAAQSGALAAMEPAGERREDFLVPWLTISVSASPQWSPPASGGIRLANSGPLADGRDVAQTSGWSASLAANVYLSRSRNGPAWVRASLGGLAAF
jgi:hypothetical protein